MLKFKNKVLLFAIIFLLSAATSQIIKASELEHTGSEASLEHKRCFHSNDTLFITSITPEEERAIQSIENTPLNSLGALTKELQYFNSIADLRVTLGFFSSNYDQQEDLKAKHTDFENYIKNLNILFMLGDKTSLSIFTKVYCDVQKKYHEAMVQEDMDTLIIPDKKLYKFYFKNFSLMSTSIRNLLSEKYRDGIYPFKQNTSKHIKYSSNLGLQLTIEKISPLDY